MKAIDLFAGWGGFTLAARRAGVDVAWAANHWPLAVQVHSANHPETEHSCQDLRQADWTRLPRYDVLLASPACVPADALIERGDGTRARADDLRVGDEVLTHEGRRRAIVNVWRKTFTGEMVSFDVWGATRLPVEMTADHLVWIRRRGHDGKLGAPRFIPAGEVRPGDYVGFPRVAGDSEAAARFVRDRMPGRIAYTSYRSDHRNTRTSSLPGAKIPLREAGTDLWWLLGQYLGDGQLRADRPQIGWSVGGSSENAARVAGILGRLGLRCWRRGPSSNLTISTSSTHLYALCSSFGRLCHEKRIPEELLRDLDAPEAEALIRGYLDADGWERTDRKVQTFKATSTSLALLQDLQRLCWRIGWSAGVQRQMPARESTIEGRRVACRETWDAQLVPQPHAQSRTKFDLDPARIWRSVRAVTRTTVRDIPVFDFEVDEDHTFCLPGVIVHNCQGHSTASQPRRRIYHDAMRSTAWAVVDCADVTEPRHIIVENVPAFRRWRLYPLWRETLAALGYHLQELEVTASHHGVPQRRERLFIVGSKRPGRIILPKRPEPAFGPFLDPAAGGWRPVREATPGAQARIAKGRARHGRRFLTQHVTGHPGVPLSEPIRTITTAPQHWALVDGDRYRYLTTRELARGMGFPDSFTWPEDLAVQQVTEGLGNAVCPPAGEAVIRAALGASPMRAAA